MTNAPGQLDRPRLLSRRDVARLFDVSPGTVARWAREARIPSVTTLGGHRRYRVEDVLPLVARCLGREPAAWRDAGREPAG